MRCLVIDDEHITPGKPYFFCHFLRPDCFHSTRIANFINLIACGFAAFTVLIRFLRDEKNLIYSFFILHDIFLLQSNVLQRTRFFAIINAIC
jgi:hypothetical protein